MNNIKEQFVRLYYELELTDDTSAMLKKLQRDVEKELRDYDKLKNKTTNISDEEHAKLVKDAMNWRGLKSAHDAISEIFNINKKKP
jgi:hypothetical protein